MKERANGAELLVGWLPRTSSDAIKIRRVTSSSSSLGCSFAPTSGSRRSWALFLLLFATNTSPSLLFRNLFCSSLFLRTWCIPTSLFLLFPLFGSSADPVELRRRAPGDSPVVSVFIMFIVLSMDRVYALDVGATAAASATALALDS